MLFTDLVSTSCVEDEVKFLYNMEMYLVDAANPEAEGTTLDSRAIHIITNQKNELNEAKNAETQVKFSMLTLSNSLNDLASSKARPASASFLAACGQSISGYVMRWRKRHQHHPAIPKSHGSHIYRAYPRSEVLTS